MSALGTIELPGRGRDAEPTKDLLVNSYLTSPASRKRTSSVELPTTQVPSSRLFPPSLCNFPRCQQQPNTKRTRGFPSTGSRISLSECNMLEIPNSGVPGQSFVDTFARLYIFDWDNTLCPTDWLCELYSNCGQSVYTARGPCSALCSTAVQSRLAAFESSVRHLLQKCKNRGQVTILSNATTIGLLKTLSLLPVVRKTLAELKVQVVSARDVCEPRGLPLEEWKDTVLIQLVSAFIRKCPQQKHSVMTIGDQDLEHIALHRAAAHLLLNRGWQCYPKCIKYVENPSVEALTRQTLSLSDLIDRFADDEIGTYWMQKNKMAEHASTPQAC